MRLNLVALSAFVMSMIPSFVKAQIDHVPLFRVELRVHTCDKSNAGTTDDVWVELNDNMGRYYLDGAGTERGRGEWNTYDIVTDDLSSVADIQYIRVGNHGSDSWCFDSVYLYINRNDGGVDPANAFRVYAIALASTWIDGPGGNPDTHQLNNLRSNITWAASGPRASALSAPMGEIRGETLRQMFEDAYGDAMGPEGFMYDWSWRSGGSISITTIGFVAGRATLGLRQLSTSRTLATSYLLTYDCDGPGGEWTSMYFGPSNPLAVNGVGTSDPALLFVQAEIQGAMAAGFERNLVGAAFCAPGATAGSALVNSVGDVQF